MTQSLNPSSLNHTVTQSHNPNKKNPASIETRLLKVAQLVGRGGHPPMAAPPLRCRVADIARRRCMARAAARVGCGGPRVHWDAIWVWEYVWDL